MTRTNDRSLEGGTVVTTGGVANADLIASNDRISLSRNAPRSLWRDAPVTLTQPVAHRPSLARFVERLCAGLERVLTITVAGRIASGFGADFMVMDMAARKTIGDLRPVVCIGQSVKAQGG